MRKQRGYDTTDHRPGTTEHEPFTKKITVHPRPLILKPPTTDQIRVVKPLTIDHTTNMFYLMLDCPTITILWYRVSPYGWPGLNLELRRNRMIPYFSAYKPPRVSPPFLPDTCTTPRVPPPPPTFPLTHDNLILAPYTLLRIAPTV